ncbi:hypothetical protein SERLA73DRAFT_160870 [Serpula lacrymans var. lacrymans S7.3]|uniref:Heterokaryon incompatibility domain-containing protein n=1 Tax=Serpula lacrymans var. lacrymans (strain S7.3) TaxID=936435 RepID=F8Q0G6_SERL3|nr:hypothetical protein SERLA73DRAFT_160870 [Serpula lacrymans var. lacrymans S7.3]
MAHIVVELNWLILTSKSLQVRYPSVLFVIQMVAEHVTSALAYNDMEVARTIGLSEFKRGYLGKGNIDSNSNALTRLRTTSFDDEFSTFESRTDWGVVNCFVKIALMSSSDDVEESTVHLYRIENICFVEFLYGSSRARVFYILSKVCTLWIGGDAVANAWNGQSSENIEFRKITTGPGRCLHINQKGLVAAHECNMAEKVQAPTGMSFHLDIFSAQHFLMDRGTSSVNQVDQTTVASAEFSSIVPGTLIKNTIVIQSSRSGAIIGGVVGSTAGLVLLGLLIIYLRRNRRKDNFDANSKAQHVLNLSTSQQTDRGSQNEVPLFPQYSSSREGITQQDEEHPNLSLNTNTGGSYLSEENAPLCSTCAGLNFHLLLRNGVQKENAFPLGPLISILQKSDHCGFCRLVSMVIRQTWRLDKLPDVDLSEINCALYSMKYGYLHYPEPASTELCHRLYVHPSGRPWEINTAMRASQQGYMLDIQLLEEDAPKFGRTNELHGRRMGENFDVRLAKKWIELCENDHGDACESVWWRGDDKNLPGCVRMLDVSSMTVVPAPPACRYVALSYLWGGMGGEYWTTRANLEQRSISGGLDASMLPGTISDAIQLVRQLDERYLWIDALCIIQDDPEDKGVQIRVMELIYGSAVFTIFAAGGSNADAPLPGLRPGTRERKQHIEIIQDLHLTVPLPIPRGAISQTVWNTRGWTFQELELSRRRIFFTDQQVYFECGQDVWCEDVVAECERQPYTHQPLRYNGVGDFISLRPPKSWDKEGYVVDYTSAIGRYTQRQLTVESDIVDAVTALTNAWTKAFKLNEVDGSEDTPWPSWSWAGWRGAHRYFDDRQFVNFHRGNNYPLPTESLVNHWFIVEESGEIVSLDVTCIDRIIVHPERESGLRRYSPPRGTVDQLQLDIRNIHPKEPGTLIFRTSSAYFNVTELENDASGIPAVGTHHAVFSLLSNAPPSSARVGRVILPVSTCTPVSLEFVVLSRTGGPLGAFDEDIFGKRYSDCFLYVMAVQKIHQRKTLERIGVGIIFERAWIDSLANEKVVLLR